MFILSVIPITKSIDTEALSYFSAKEVSLGQLVTVPLRKKEITGIVVGKEAVQNMKTQLRGAQFQIRNILKVHDTQVFSPAFLKAASQTKEYYATTSGRIINHMTPQLILKNIGDIPMTFSPSHASFEQHVLQRNHADRMIYYRTYVREHLLRQKSVHIICPTIQSVEEVFAAVSRGIESQSFCITSTTKKKQSLQIYEAVMKKASVVVSTAKFIDLPQIDKHSLIIEEESSEYYRTIAQPYIDMRIFMQNYAKHTGLQYIVADTVIRAESYHATETGTALIIEPLGRKIFQKDDLQIIQINKKQGLMKQSDAERLAEIKQTKKKKTQGFTTLSKEAKEAIRSAISKKERIYLYTHKKALAPSIVCNACGNVAVSPDSGFPYSLYMKKVPGSSKKERIFVCHQTGERIPAFDTCQFCGNWDMVQLGIGTQRVFDDLEKSFPKTKKFIIDGDSSQKDIKEALEVYENHPRSVIIVGTEKALPLLPSIDQSIIISLDSYFSRMSHLVHEQVLKRISKISERTANTTLLQTRNIVDTLLPTLRDGMYRPFITHELKEREEYHYPPFSTLITIEHKVPQTRIAKEYADMNTLFSKWNPNIFTKPHGKASISLFVVLQLDTEKWNTEYQDESLKELLYGFDRSTIVRVNPSRFDG